MRRLILFFIFLSLFGAGCVQNRADYAPKIDYGREACAECRMIIGDPRFSAALIDTSREVSKFDDIGCMRTYERKHAIAIQKAWVHDYMSEAWIEQANAVFVHAEDLVTPMGYGIVAFSHVEEAEQFLAKHPGQRISWDGISEALHKDHE